MESPLVNEPSSLSAELQEINALKGMVEITEFAMRENARIAGLLARKISEVTGHEISEILDAAEADDDEKLDLMLSLREAKMSAILKLSNQQAGKYRSERNGLRWKLHDALNSLEKIASDDGVVDIRTIATEAIIRLQAPIKKAMTP
jgi:hypothetical protein